MKANAERERLAADGRREANWKRWDTYPSDPHFKDLLLFHAYFHGDSGQGLGASHQTGWTALVAKLLEDAGRRRAAGG